MSKYMMINVGTGEKVYTDDLPFSLSNLETYIDMNDGWAYITKTEMYAGMKRKRSNVGVFENIPTDTVINGVTYQTSNMILRYIYAFSDEIRRYTLVFSDTEKYEFDSFSNVKTHIAGLGTDLLILQISDTDQVVISTNVDGMLTDAKAQVYVIDKTNTTMDKKCVMRVNV